MAKTIGELRNELKAKKGQLNQLRARRGKIVGRLRALDGQIAALRGAAPRRPTGKKAVAPAGPARTKKKQSLSDVLAAVLTGRGPVKVAQAAQLALRAGYKTASSQFGNIVSQSLSDDKRFRKLSRGVYALIGGPAPAKKAAAKTSAKAAGGKGRKGLQPGSLASRLVQAMSGKKAMSVKDAMQAVLATGYKTGAKDFRTVVNQALTQGKQFRKVGRGMYVLKG